MERMAEKGFVSKNQVEQERAGLRGAEQMLEAWRQEQRGLTDRKDRPDSQPPRP
jgi:hypothetical protein